MTEPYAYQWNAPREAIASPYPTYDEIQHRNLLNAQKAELIAKLNLAHHLLEKQPQIVLFDIKRRRGELEKLQGEIRANAYLIKTFVERTLPRIECVNTKYRLGEMNAGTQTLLTNNSPKAASAARAGGALWELMRSFNRLTDMARADVDILTGDIANFVLAALVQAHT